MFHFLGPSECYVLKISEMHTTCHSISFHSMKANYERVKSFSYNKKMTRKQPMMSLVQLMETKAFLSKLLITNNTEKIRFALTNQE